MKKIFFVLISSIVCHASDMPLGNDGNTPTPAQVAQNGYTYQPSTASYARPSYIQSVKPLHKELVDTILMQAPKEIKIFIQALERKDEMKEEIDRTILLVGRRGTGKSTLPVAIAQKFLMECTFVKCPLLGDEYQNSGAQNLDRAIQPLLQTDSENFKILVLDEVESILGINEKKRDSNQSSNRSTSYAFLSVMDSILKGNSNILVFATSNKVKFCGPVKRRFGIYAEFILPTSEMRKTTVEYYLKQSNVLCSSEIMNSILKQTQGYSGSDLELLIKKLTRQIKLSSSDRTVTQCALNETFALIREYPSLSHLHTSYFSRACKWVKKNKQDIYAIAGIVLPIFFHYRQTQMHAEGIALQQQALLLQQSSLSLQQASMQQQEKAIGLQQEGLKLQEKSIALQEGNQFQSYIQTSMQAINFGIMLYKLWYGLSPISFAS